MSEFEKGEIDIKKSSIKEFDQSFMDSITTTIPKKNNFYVEVFYDFFGNKNPKNQKVNILKSAELINKENEISFKTIQNKIQPIVDIRVKRDSYFKFKSGIFPLDIDIEVLGDIRHNHLSNIPTGLWGQIIDKFIRKFISSPLILRSRGYHMNRLHSHYSNKSLHSVVSKHPPATSITGTRLHSYTPLHNLITITSNLIASDDINGFSCNRIYSWSY